MNRNAFLDLLTRAVREQFLTEEEARDLLRRFDAGEIEVSEDDAPLDFTEALAPVTDDDVEKAVGALLVLGTLSYLHLRRAHFREVLQDRFIERAKGLASAKALGKMTLPEWQAGMGEQVRSHIIQQVAVGSGRIPAASSLSEAVGLQDAYLSRWADQQLVGTLLDEPASELAMMARAARYAGAGRAEGYRAEWDLPDGVPVPGAVCLGGGNCRCRLEEVNGFLEYISVDDNSTCEPCLDAEGFYPLPEELAA